MLGSPNGAAPACRLPPVEVDDAASPLLERRDVVCQLPVWLHEPAITRAENR
jgi:hypothetical protein